MRRKIGVTLLTLGVVGIVVGLVLGQNVGVFRKAMLICFECIGIG